MFDKISATWWAICCGVGMVHYFYNQEKHPWSFVGALLYFLLFLATLYQIKAKQSIFMWYFNRRKKRKEDEEQFWNQRVADGDI